MRFDMLSRKIARLKDEPVPSDLTNRLMADAMQAAADARSQVSASAHAGRAWEVRRMRKVMAVAAFAAVLIGVGIWMLPRVNGNYALAQVARAMAQVKSVHFVGYITDPESGDRRKLEGWLKGPDKYRTVEEGRMEQVIVGDKSTTIRLSGPEPEALIQHAGDVEPQVTIAMFRSGAALDYVMRHIRAEVTRSRNTTLNGSQVTVTELGSRGGRALIYADADTDLIARFEQYSPDGKLIVSLKEFEYDTDLPDSVFSTSIPKGVPVVDLTVPISPEKVRWRRDQEMTLFGYESDGRGGWHGVGRSMMPFFDAEPQFDPPALYHPEFTFKLLKPYLPDRDFARVFYLPDENVYKVLGAVRVMGPHGFSRIVEDGNIRLPGKPQIYETLVDNGRPSAYCSFGRSKTGRELDPYRLLNVGNGPLTVLWDKSRELIVIRGKAKLLPTGEMYANKAIRLDHIGTPAPLSSLRNPDYGGLPPAEAKLAREELDILQRRARLVKEGERDHHWVLIINGAVAEYYTPPMGNPRDLDLLIEGSGRAIPSIYTVPSRREYYVFGRARVKVKGRPDQFVKNSVISFDGEVISSEK